MTTRLRSVFLLLLAVACIIAAALVHWLHHRAGSPETVRRAVQASLHRSEVAAQALLADTLIMAHLASGTLSRAEEQRLLQQPFHLFAGNDAGLYYWNTKLTADEPQLRGAAWGAHLQQLQQYTGLLIRQRLPGPDTGRFAAAFLPLLVQYPYENNYLKSHLIAAPLFNATVSAPATGKDSGLPVKFRNGRVAAMLQGVVALADQDAVAVPLLVCLGLLLLLLWAGALAVGYARSGRVYMGLGVMMAAILADVYLLFCTRPFSLNSWELFAPQWYAGGWLLPSLGAVLVLAIGIIYLLSYAIYAWPDPRFRVRRAAVWGPAVTIAIAAMGMAGVYIGCVLLLRSLVADATQLFDPSHSLQLSYISFSFFSTIALLLLAGGGLIYFLQRITGLHPVRHTALLSMAYAASAAATGVATLLLHLDARVALAYAVLMACLLLTRWLQARRPRLHILLVAWLALAAAAATIWMHVVNDTREAAQRTRLAGSIAAQRDDLLEWHFQSTARNIAGDDSIRSFFRRPTEQGRAMINRRIGTYYLTSWLSNYNADAYCFGRDSQSLHNRQGMSRTMLDARIADARPTATPGLFYAEGARDGNAYIAALPIAAANGDTLGLLYLDLSRKQTSSRSVYPELLLPANLQQARESDEYVSAIYSGRRLITQSKDFPFAEYLEDRWTGSQTAGRELGGGAVIYQYETAPGRIVVLVTEQTPWLERFTLFSYLFSILILMGLTILAARSFVLGIGRPASPGEGRTLPLRGRIQVAMLVLVFVSFVVIGVATISFLQHRYQAAAGSRMLSVLVNIENRIRSYLAERHADINPALAGSFDFDALLLKQAGLQSVDINLYGADGRLIATSQEAVYETGLLSPFILPAVYAQAWSGKTPYMLQPENLGNLRYTSAYLPLRRDDGRIEGYLNIPFFNAQKELDQQIANIVVTLINLFVIVFLISGILSLPLSRWMTRSLEAIAGRLRTVDVNRKNELLHWPHQDAIGSLVSQYNKMVATLEESARKLEHASREEAWREMAQQIAHEVKNPLTPMKLSVQYLQGAIAQGRADVPALAARACTGLLEQIEHLSHIASSFSAFARMPAARPERLVLNEFLSKAAQLYMDVEGLHFKLNLPEEELVVHADRSWIQSILTNLLENAAQALNGAPDGHLSLSLERADAVARIAVADNGPGIAPEVREKIFRPYFTTKSSGTGLGLAMTRRMAEGSGGHIWFESKEGAGTAFFLELPLGDI